MDKKHILYIVAGMMIASIVPILIYIFPSRQEISRRLNDVIAACAGSEQSRICSELQEKYRITFEYCYSYADIPEISKNIPIYAVARKNSFKIKSIKDGKGVEGNGLYPYYGCVSRYDSAGTTNTESLLKNPKYRALHELSTPPVWTVKGNTKKCTILQMEPDDTIWEGIPNIKTYINKYKKVVKKYKYCSSLSKISSSLTKVSQELVNYSNNKSVQLFYEGYGEWAGFRGEDGTSTEFANLMRKSMVTSEYDYKKL